MAMAMAAMLVPKLKKTTRVRSAVMTRPSELSLRVLVALLLVMIGYSAVTRSYSIAWAKTNAVSASSLVPTDARISARAAQILFQRAKTGGDRRSAIRVALRSLDRDATAIPAIVTLGLSAGMLDDVRASNAWFDYSQKLSRRDVPTQLYFIESSVSEGNVTETLRHYDIAFRVSEAIRPTLYPILESAVGNASVRTALAKMLVEKPLWGEDFMADLAAKGPELTAAAQLFVEIRRMGGVIPKDIASALLNRLVVDGDILVAWRYYTATHPGADRSIIRNPGFEPSLEESTPFDWQMSTDGGVEAALNTGEAGGLLDYQLSPTVGAIVTRQLVVAAPGKYRLGSVLKAASQPVESGPYWELKCSDGRSIGTLEMGGPVSGERRFSKEITIPSDCPYQILALIVRPSDDIQGSTGRVTSISLVTLN